MKTIFGNILNSLNLGILREYNLLDKDYSFKIKVPLSNFVVTTRLEAADSKKYLSSLKDKDGYPKIDQITKSKIELWETESDNQNIKPSAQNFRAEITKNIYAESFKNKMRGHRAIKSGRSFWRIETMKRIRKENPGIFKGTIIEIGAGTGIVTSAISNFPEVEKIYSLDYDSYSVSTMMPLVQWATNANAKKIIRVHGSYNNIKLASNSVDTVVAVGSMHHSENLITTLNECFRILKPGGNFLISDYCLNSNIRQEEYRALFDKPVSEKDASKVTSGKPIESVKTNKDISEHARPAFIYQFRAFEAGFNVNTTFFDATSYYSSYVEQLLYYSKSKLCNQLFTNTKDTRELGYDSHGNVNSFGVRENTRYPIYAKGRPNILSLVLKGPTAGKPVYDNLLLILNKPLKKTFDIKIKYSSGFLYRSQFDFNQDHSEKRL